MIERVDRIQLVTHDRRRAAETWHRLFDAEVVREDGVTTLAATRTVLRAGASEIELLQPHGLGAVAQFVSRSRTSVFAVGLTTPDVAELAARLDARAIHHVAEGEQLLLTGEWLGVPGLRLVVSPNRELEPAGLLSRIYEATHLMQGFAKAVDRLVKVFDLDPSNAVPIRSDQYGYDGVLVRFHEDRLDRIETITPVDRTKTMGRFFARQGPCLYMFYAEAADTAAVRERLLEHAPEDWTGPADAPMPDNLFVHPRALDGALMGVSRDSFAWTWSGDPSRVQPVR